MRFLSDRRDELYEKLMAERYWPRNENARMSHQRSVVGRLRRTPPANPNWYKDGPTAQWQEAVRSGVIPGKGERGGSGEAVPGMPPDDDGPGGGGRRKPS